MRLIDADALLKKAIPKNPEAQFRCVSVNDIINAPTVKAQPKTGKWIDKSGGIEGAWNYCSVCGEQAIDLYDYCPNCGADMRGEQDE